MKKKLKNYLRTLGEKWKSIDKISRFTGIAIIITSIIIFMTTPNISSFLKQENYTAMKQVITDIVEEKNTDVKFDTSKIDNYEVKHKENGIKEICIQGKALEVMYITLEEDYQIKELVKGGELNLIFVYLLYFLIVNGIGYIITVILFSINKPIKKIVNFFKIS